MKIKAGPSAKPRVVCSFDSTGRIKALYEAAGMGPRMQRKGLVGVGGPNADISRSLPNLVKRSHHAMRNNPYAVKAKETYVSSVIGNGLTAIWPNEQMQQLWDYWAEHCSADDRGSMLDLQMLAAATQFESGEVLARRRLRSAGDGLAVPLQIQLLEGSHLDIGYNVYRKHNPVLQGIQFDALDNRQYYHLWKYNPEDLSGIAEINERRGVKAQDVIHLFRRLRPGQIRGIPELTPVLIRLYEIDEMQDATLVKQKTAQLFAWIITQEAPQAGEVSETNDIGEGMELGEAVEAPTGEQLSKIVPGAAHYLQEGEKIEFSSPDGIGANYAAWLKTELRAVAAGAGITYEQLTGDLEGVNYSSIRAGLIEFRRRIEQLQLTLFINRFMQPIAQWFADTVVAQGLVDLSGYWFEPWKHLPKFGSPKWDWVDPVKDVMGDILEVRGGLSTLKAKLAERNMPFEDTVAQLAVEQAIDLVLDTNPAAVTKSGQLQQAQALLAAEN